MGLQQDWSRAWRDYAVDGVPSSGRNNPDKAQIRALGITINDAISGVRSSFAGTSSSSNTIGTGPMTFAVQSDLSYFAGQRLRGGADATHWIEGIVTSYSDTTLELDIDLTAGTGTFAAWSFGPAGEKATSSDTDSQQDAASSPSMVFTRFNSGSNVAVPAANTVTGYHASMAANPAPVIFNDKVFMYFRSDPGNDIQSIGLVTSSVEGFTGNTNWTDQGQVITWNDGGGGTWDPAAVVFKDKIWVYRQSHKTFNLCAAYSTDGKTFTILGDLGFKAGTPGLVVIDDVLHLYFNDIIGTPPANNNTDPASGFQYYHATSTDGVTFTSTATYVPPYQSAPLPGKLCFQPSNVFYQFDQLSIEPVRLVYEAPYLYMFYGGSPKFNDFPEGIGVARAVAPFDTFERSQMNPVFLRGPAGSWDEGAVWSFSPIKINGRWFGFYEGYGSNTTAGGTTSNNTRDQLYAGFRTTGFSQVLVAAAPVGASFVNWYPDVTAIPTGFYTIKNVLSKKYLGATGGAVTSGTATTQYVSAQPWYIERLHDGFYRISLAAAGPSGAQVLDVAGASRSQAAVVDIYPAGYGNPAHEWKLLPVSQSGAGHGVFTIVNRNSGLSLEVAGASTAEGATVQQYTGIGAPNQQWQINRQ